MKKMILNSFLWPEELRTYTEFPLWIQQHFHTSIKHKRKSLIMRLSEGKIIMYPGQMIIQDMGGMIVGVTPEEYEENFILSCDVTDIMANETESQPVNIKDYVVKE